MKTKAAEELMKRRFWLAGAIADSLRFKRELQLSNEEFIRGVFRLKRARGASLGNLARIPVGMAALKRAIVNGDEDGIMMAGQDCGRIEDTPGCAELIGRIVAEAEAILAAKGRS